MELYLIAGLMTVHFLAVINYVDSKVVSPNHLLVFWIVAIGWLLMLVVRSQGWDFALYSEMYDGATFENAFSQWTDPFFLLLMAFSKSIGLNFWMFNLIVSLLAIILLAGIIRSVSCSPLVALWFFLLFYYFRFPYGQMRQSLAILLVLYSIFVLESRSWKALFLLLAISLHSSAIVAVGFIIFRRFFRVSVWNVCALLLGAVFFGVFVDLLISGFAPEWGVLAKYNYYRELDDQRMPVYMAAEFPKIAFGVLTMLFIYPRSKLLGDVDRLLIETYFFGVFVFLLFSFDLRLADRVSVYFTMIYFLLIARALVMVGRGWNFLMLIAATSLGVFYLQREFSMMKDQAISYGC